MTIRVQHIPESISSQAEPQPADLGQGSARVHAGPIRYGQDAGHAEPVQAGVARHQVSFDGTSGGSILATRQKHGPHETVELIPGDPSSRTLLRVAVREGLLKETAPGIYADALTSTGQQRTLETVQAEQQQAAHEQRQALEEQQVADSAGIFNPQEDAAWQADMESIPEHAFRSTMAGVVNAVTLGTDFSGAVDALVRDAAMEPAQATEVVENAYWAQEQIVARALAKVGISEDMKEAAYTDFQQNPGKLQNALHYLLHGRDVSHLQQMGRDWLDRTQRQAASKGPERPTASPASGLEGTLQAAGFETSTSPQGVLLIKTGPSGKWVPAADVLRA
ncbi:hypothetical protein [Caldimonas tepidiphila]|uniref:hypothetical protein n=1 Tax=Caldimonas tepidiphila TaxID=2315841 RepID=UPI000E5B9EDE|nr:hypothetical protein [Caldimonas tepidiphila]